MTFFHAVATMFLCAALAAPVCAGSSPWQWQNPLPQGNNLGGVFLVDADTFTATGQGATVMYTTDAGASWALRDPDSQLDFGMVTDVFFVDADTGFASVSMSAFFMSGTEVPILRTIDGGQTWTTQYTGIVGDSNLRAVHFSDALRGWMVGSRSASSCAGGPLVLRTVDGGASWQDVTNAPGLVTDASCPMLNAVHFVDADTGFVLMDRRNTDGAALYGTVDGGASWTPIVTPETPNNLDIFMFDADTGLLTTGTDGIWHTADGGETWTQTWTGGYFPAVHFVDAEHGWAVGAVDAASAIVHSSDGGMTWSTQSHESPPSLFLEDVHFADAQNGVAVGRSGVILHTTNGGTSWRELTGGHEFGIQLGLKDVDFVDAFTGWAVGSSGVILHTADGGANWSPQNSGWGNTFTKVSFPDARHGWVLSANAILHTANGGENWSLQNSGTSFTLYGMQMLDADSGWVVGFNGTMLRTTNGGANWTSVTSGTTSALMSIFFLDDDHGWAVGLGGAVLRTVDGGQSWSVLDPLDMGTGAANAMLFEVYFADPDNGWAVGYDQGNGSAVVMRSLDGGDNWIVQFDDMRGRLNDIGFADHTTGFIAGSGGTVLRTADGGDSWMVEPRITNGGLEAIAVIDADTAVWAVGVPGGGAGSGVILRRGTAVVPPDVTILEPEDGAVFEEGDEIAFSASAFDAAGDDISGQLEWTSSLDGPIGSGMAFTTAALSAGTHAISAEVTDGEGVPGSDMVEIMVKPFGHTAPAIQVDPDSLSAEVAEAAVAILPMTIHNLGVDGLEWQVVEGERARERAAWLGSAEATLTHSESMDILADHTFVCPTQTGTTRINSFLRRFVLADFEISSDFEAVEVTFGVQEMSGVTVSITVNLYTLEGDFVYANMTLIGSADIEIAPQQLELVTVPVGATVPADSTLVVEIAAPDLTGIGVFRPGSNDLGETAPSYIASVMCGMPEPRPYDEVIFPGVSEHTHLVMAVAGEVPEPVDCTLPVWAGIDPASGEVASGDHQVMEVSFDAGELPLGDYQANLCLASNDPQRPLVVVPLSMTVIEAPQPGLLELSPMAIDFGEVGIGDLRHENVNVTNAAQPGAAALELSVLEVNAGASAFTVTGGDCSIGTRLEPGESCAVQLGFGPNVPGAAEGELEVATNSGQNATAGLSGIGTEPEPQPNPIFLDRFEPHGP